MGLKEDIVDLANQTNNVERSLAMEILNDYKLANKRLYTLFIVFICLTIPLITGLAIYNAYILNDTTTVETTEVQQDNESGDNNYIGNDGDINGKAKNKNN